VSDGFRLVPIPDWATDTYVNETLWPLIEQIAREEAEEQEKNREQP
jgi:hypothetical protein